MRVEVAPAEHYARMYQSMLDRNPKMDSATQTLLRQALREAIAAAYRLDDLVVQAKQSRRIFPRSCKLK